MDLYNKAYSTSGILTNIFWKTRIKYVLLETNIWSNIQYLNLQANLRNGQGKFITT